MNTVHLPPLFTAMLTAGADPFEAACTAARQGCDAGLVTYDISADRLRAAIVFAPEIALTHAMVMQPICGIGFQNALGTLAPPEVSVHLEWGGALRVNGAKCGTLKTAAHPADPAQVPNWLVVGLGLTLWADTQDTGLTPDVTSLYAEGCSDVPAGDLLEAWVRHTLSWINRWDEDGVQPVHSEWTGLAHGISDNVTVNGLTGTFRGIDETFGLLLQPHGPAQIIPLTHTLKDVS
ncbi:DUF4444 domain-containing protein [Planktotalea sp.]|uniref:biotin/lipoate--protein ligase family protein n=1 Tax=Planktotalea sp. TaxID=2029877 RepID=UPI0032998C0B